MGRTATGVKGIELDKKDQVIALVVVRRKCTLLTVTEKGMGKRSELDEYRVQHRGGRGIITLKRSDKTGDVIALSPPLIVEKDHIDRIVNVLADTIRATA